MEATMNIHVKKLFFSLMILTTIKTALPASHESDTESESDSELGLESDVTIDFYTQEIERLKKLMSTVKRQKKDDIQAQSIQGDSGFDSIFISVYQALNDADTSPEDQQDISAKIAHQLTNTDVQKISINSLQEILTTLPQHPILKNELGKILYTEIKKRIENTEFTSLITEPEIDNDCIAYITKCTTSGLDEEKPRPMCFKSNGQTTYKNVKRSIASEYMRLLKKLDNTKAEFLIHNTSSQVKSLLFEEKNDLPSKETVPNLFSQIHQDLFDLMASNNLNDFDTYLEKNKIILFTNDTSCIEAVLKQCISDFLNGNDKKAIQFITHIQAHISLETLCPYHLLIDELCTNEKPFSFTYTSAPSI